MDIRIISVEIHNLPQLTELSRRTFVDTFSASNTAENMNAYLADHLTTESLLKELGNPDSRFWFAVLDNRPVGYLKLNFGPAQTELKAPDGVEIERIYVLGAFHGQGVAQLLYKKAVEVAVSRKASYLWLGVWEKNPRAIAFYRKNGFVSFDKHPFRLGDDVQTDMMMRLELQESIASYK